MDQLASHSATHSVNLSVGGKIKATVNYLTIQKFCRLLIDPLNDLVR